MKERECGVNNSSSSAKAWAVTAVNTIDVAVKDSITPTTLSSTSTTVSPTLKCKVASTVSTATVAEAPALTAPLTITPVEPVKVGVSPSGPTIPGTNITRAQFARDYNRAQQNIGSDYDSLDAQSYSSLGGGEQTTTVGGQDITSYSDPYDPGTDD